MPPAICKGASPLTSLPKDGGGQRVRNLAHNGRQVTSSPSPSGQLSLFFRQKINLLLGTLSLGSPHCECTNTCARARARTHTHTHTHTEFHSVFLHLFFSLQTSAIPFAFGASPGKVPCISSNKWLSFFFFFFFVFLQSPLFSVNKTQLSPDHKKKVVGGGVIYVI